MPKTGPKDEQIDVFIAYSGEVAGRLAEKVAGWLSSILPRTRTFVAERDIEKGGKWREILHRRIRESQVTLLCLTPEGLKGSWIYYEAGESNRGSNKICPLLFGATADQLAATPLEQFQATEFSREDMGKLAQAIKSHLSLRRPGQAVLTRKLDAAWPKLYRNIRKILNQQTTSFVDRIKGPWWERVYSEEATEISFFRIVKVPRQDMLRIVDGTGFGTDPKTGRLHRTASWRSEVLLVDSERDQVAYLWNGEALFKSGEARKGIGQITFDPPEKGRITRGGGTFHDTNHSDYYAQKAFALKRATPKEAKTMTSGSAAQKLALVKRKLKTFL